MTSPLKRMVSAPSSAANVAMLSLTFSALANHTELYQKRFWSFCGENWRENPVCQRIPGAEARC
jgi:hypothetical protein